MTILIARFLLRDPPPDFAAAVSSLDCLDSFVVFNGELFNLAANARPLSRSFEESKVLFAAENLLLLKLLDVAAPPEIVGSGIV